MKKIFIHVLTYFSLNSDNFLQYAMRMDEVMQAERAAHCIGWPT